jgi:SAM-dependent methyltransferase
MRPQVHEWVRRVRDHYRLNDAEVLDVGSYDVNGNVRDLFSPGRYTGLDMRAGPNVDIVADAERLPFADGLFGCVTCLETLEHCRRPWLVVAELRRVLRPGGVLILTVPSIGFPLHEYPSDYWRVTPAGLRVLYDGMAEVQVFGDATHAYGVGRNRPASR